MTRTAALILALALAAGCTTIYQSATEERSVGEQADDTRLKVTIQKRLLDSGAKTLAAIDVFCHLGVVVLTGVVEPGSTVGADAVRIARGVEGVRRVETVFVPARPSRTSDLGISAKLKAKVVGDTGLLASQVDWSVLAGTVVLVGVVDRQEKIDRVVAHARGIDGVANVRSFVQVKAP
jgi:hyperosmotically inducible protein